jgi:arylsulfatase A-like enzyme
VSALLRNPQAAWPHPCLYEYTGDVFGSPVAEKVLREPARAEHHDVPWYTAVVRNNWKLIHYLQPEVGDELYDLGSDPEELDNRINQQDARERLADLRSALQTELDRSKAGFPSLP